MFKFEFSPIKVQASWRLLSVNENWNGFSLIFQSNVSRMNLKLTKFNLSLHIERYVIRLIFFFQMSFTQVLFTQVFRTFQISLWVFLFTAQECRLLFCYYLLISMVQSFIRYQEYVVYWVYFSVFCFFVTSMSLNPHATTLVSFVSLLRFKIIFREIDRCYENFQAWNIFYFKPLTQMLFGVRPRSWMFPNVGRLFWIFSCAIIRGFRPQGDGGAFAKRAFRIQLCRLPFAKNKIFIKMTYFLKKSLPFLRDVRLWQLL